VDPVPDPLLLKTSGTPGIEPGTSMSGTRNSDHSTIGAVKSNFTQPVIDIKKKLNKLHPKECNKY
jgi:hypothetical protein